MRPSACVRFTLLAALTLCILAGDRAVAQVTQVQDLGAIPASQAYQGMGWNVDTDAEWEFKAAADAGARTVRFPCAWNRTESQSAPPANTNAGARYTLPSDCQNALGWAKKYNLKPTVVAAYGPPYHQLLNFTVPGGAAIGATSVSIEFASGVGGVTLASLKPFYDLFLRTSDQTPVTGIHSYAGSLIIGVTQTDATHATLTLASALTAALPADATLYTVNELLYPPCFTFSPTDPSVIAFADYARFLATQIAASGLKGEVELWNAPPWLDDVWDQGEDFYDHFPGYPVPSGPIMGYLANYGFAANLQMRTDIPAGVTFNWSGTNGSGGNSVLGPNMLPNSGSSLLEPSLLIAAESFRPFGNSPEDELWSEPCLKQVDIANVPSCNLNNPDSNIVQAEYFDLEQKRLNPAYGLMHTITETGLSMKDADEPHIARFTMREYLGFQAANVKMIQFASIYAASGPYSFFAPAANASGPYAPLPSYTALAGLNSDLALIEDAPVAPYSAADLTSVSTYSGTYPLDVTHMVGTRKGDTVNSELVTLWQQSRTANDSIRWGTLAQPAAAPVALLLPTGMMVASVTNLATRASVPFGLSGQTVSLSVSDDPIGIVVVPAPISPILAVQSISIPYGSASAVLNASIRYVGIHVPSGAVTLSIDGQAGAVAVCQLLASPVTCAASLPTGSLAPGSHTITATVAADAYFTAASATGNLTVLPPDFALVNAGPTSATLQPGGSTSYNFTLSPASGTMFPQAVVLTASGLPSGIAYTLTPTNVAGIAGTQSVELHIRQTTAAVEPPTVGGKGLVTSLCVVLLFWGGGTRKRLRRGPWASLLLILAAGATLCGLSGCTLIRDTAARTYDVTVTATSGSVQHSSTVSLTF